MSLDYVGNYVNKILLPGGGRKYSGKSDHFVLTYIL